MDSETAFRNFLKKAQDGDAASQVILGRVFLGVINDPTLPIRPDIDKSVMYFRMAAEQGHLEAQMSLAAIFRRKYGGGPLNDIQESNRWLYKAAESDFPPANYTLGGSHLDGQGVEKDVAKGLRLLVRAAYQNYAPAQVTLSGLYSKDFPAVVFEDNELESAAWLFVAAGNESKDAQEQASSLNLDERTIHLAQFRANEITGKIRISGLYLNMSPKAFLEMLDSLVKSVLSGSEPREVISVRCNGEELITGSTYLEILAEGFKSIDSNASESFSQMATILDYAARRHIAIVPILPEGNPNEQVAEIKKLTYQDIAKMANSKSKYAHEELIRWLPYYGAWAKRLLDLGDEKIMFIHNLAKGNPLEMAQLYDEYLGPRNKEEVEQFEKENKHEPQQIISLVQFWASSQPKREE